jgi:hypothetical protein
MIIMEKKFKLLRFFLFTCFIVPATGMSQDLPASTNAGTVTKVPGLFETDELLEISLSGSLKKLLNDRSQAPQYYPLVVSYHTGDSIKMSIAARARTRGHFRRMKENCTYPPLYLNFSKSDTLKASVFKKQDKIKLVMPCRGDEYVVREWMIYRLYNLVSPVSFKARLVRVKLDDATAKKEVPPFYGILLEDESQMAKRNGLVPVNKKLQPEQTEAEAFLTMAVFEYMIGNTDWSVQYQQNIKLVAPDSQALVTTVVPYDFDHAGLVNAPYAKPAEELHMASVRQRRYRGYCIRNLKRFEGVISHFNRLKKDIYELYSNCTLLDANYIKSTTKFLDDFYATINDPRTLEREFLYPCDESKTGNVVIKGLKDRD